MVVGMMRLAIAAVLGTILLPPAPAAADDEPLFNTAAWQTELDQQFRLGYVSAIVQSLIDNPDNGPNGEIVREGYSTCLIGETAAAVLEIVDTYIDRNVAAGAFSPDLTVRMALHERCKSYLPNPLKNSESANQSARSAEAPLPRKPFDH